ncbi:MAG: hypothetical protein JWN17_2388, partial [Frankiales bacterium]|nr:hypothetical protein [Frankiales bacterium]
MSTGTTGTGTSSRTTAPRTTLSHYLIRRSAMQLVLAEDLARSLVRERQREAAADNRAARLLTARRLERRAA